RRGGDGVIIIVTFTLNHYEAQQGRESEVDHCCLLLHLKCCHRWLAPEAREPARELVRQAWEPAREVREPAREVREPAHHVVVLLLTKRQSQSWHSREVGREVERKGFAQVRREGLVRAELRDAGNGTAVLQVAGFEEERENTVEAE
ncbi:hypothetical protein GBAR_LOCUS29984, partial [Geodia barretti]